MFNDKFNYKANEKYSENISGENFPRLKVGVLVSPRADGLFVGTFDDALLVDLPGARAALALCDGSNSIHSIAISVGILESDLIELIATLDSTALVTFEKITNQKLLPEMQLNDWYPKFTIGDQLEQANQASPADSLNKRAIATVYISKLNRIGFALSGILLTSGIGAVVSDDNRKITVADLVGGYLRLSDVGRTRSEVLADQTRENAQNKTPNNLKNISLIISTAPPDPELLAEWMRGSTPFFLIDGLDRDNLTFGPFVNPGKDACPRCIDLHCLDRDPNWNSVSLAHYLDRRRDLSTPLALLGASIGAIFALSQLDQMGQVDRVDRVDHVHHVHQEVNSKQIDKTDEIEKSGETDKTAQGKQSEFQSQFSPRFHLRGKTITYSASELMYPIIRRWSRHPLCGCSWQ